MQRGIIQDIGAAFDTAALGATANMKIDTGGGSRRLYGVLLKADGWDSTGAGQLPLFEALIENVQVLVNGKTKMHLNPALARRLDLYLNANTDPVDVSTFLVPFTRPGYPGSSWGTKDIDTLMLKAKIIGALPANHTFTRLKAQIAYVNGEPENRGSVFLQSFINQTPVAGWNQIDDLPTDNIAFASRLLFNHTAITEVEIKVRDEVVYHMEKWAAVDAINRNWLYKNAWGTNAAVADFPAFLDVLGDAGRFVDLIEEGKRKTVKVRYYLDTTIAAASTFDIALEGVELGSQQALAKAA